MDHRNDDALRFLATRRSHPPKLMTGPAPDREELTRLLTLAARAPDHGKLEPWRFIVLGRQTLDALAPSLHKAVLASGQDQAAADKAASAFASPVIVAVAPSMPGMWSVRRMTCDPTGNCGSDAGSMPSGAGPPSGECSCSMSVSESP